MGRLLIHTIGLYNLGASDAFRLIGARHIQSSALYISTAPGVAPSSLRHVPTVAPSSFARALSHLPSAKTSPFSSLHSTIQSSTDAPSPVLDPLTYFDASRIDSSTYDYESGWIAYTALRDAGRLKELQLDTILDFASRCVNIVQDVQSCKDPYLQYRWGDRITELLADVDKHFKIAKYDQNSQASKYPTLNSHHIRRTILVAQAHALRGDVDAAVQELQPLRKAHSPRHLVPGLSWAYDSCFRSACRHHGVPTALEFMVEHWSLFHVVVAQKVRPTDTEDVKSMRAAVHDVVRQIEDPHFFLVENEREWGTKPKLKSAKLDSEFVTGQIGRFLMEMMCLQNRTEEAVGVDEFMMNHDSHPAAAQNLALTRLKIVSALLKRKDRSSMVAAQRLYDDITLVGGTVLDSVPYLHAGRLLARN
jgi:hypothetical protein